MTAFSCNQNLTVEQAFRHALYTSLKAQMKSCEVVSRLTLIKIAHIFRDKTAQGHAGHTRDVKNPAHDAGHINSRGQRLIAVYRRVYRLQFRDQLRFYAFVADRVVWEEGVWEATEIQYFSYQEIVGWVHKLKQWAIFDICRLFLKRTWAMGFSMTKSWDAVGNSVRHRMASTGWPAIWIPHWRRPRCLVITDGCDCPTRSLFEKPSSPGGSVHDLEINFVIGPQHRKPGFVKALGWHSLPDGDSQWPLTIENGHIITVSNKRLCLTFIFFWYSNLGKSTTFRSKLI